MKEYKYKFSVIIPVFNVEKYLTESIESIIKQTIGFEKNIQLILVNDGSPDDSDKICKEFLQKYPNNIVYIEQENKGVSIARNEGLKHAEGKYINFLDSDDTWEKDAFKKVYSFFEKNYDEIDCVITRMRFFDAINGFSHALDYKFKNEKDRIVNIEKDYNYVQMSISSAFIKKEIIQKYRFDSKLKFSEDSIICSKVILEKSQYGLLKSVIYNYRRRKEENSAIQTKHNKKEWYIDTINYCYKELFNYSRKKFGKVIKYIQYLVMYDIQWRLNIPPKDVINEKEKKEYICNIKELLKEIEDEIIYEQCNTNLENKLYTMQLKYDNNKTEKLITYKDNNFYYQEKSVYNFYNNRLLVIRILDIKEGYLELEGELSLPTEKKDYTLYFEDDTGKKYEPMYYEMKHRKVEGIDRIIKIPEGFKVKIPIKNIKTIQAVLTYKNEQKIIPKLRYEAFSKLHTRYRYSYYQKEGYIIQSDNIKIKIYSNNFLKHLQLELIYLLQLLKHGEIKPIIYRIAYYFVKLFMRKPVWIVSDRADLAGDNGEVFYKYLLENEKEAKVYFAIIKDTLDYERLKKYGTVLNMKSLKYKFLFLQADKIISSQANEYTINAFGRGKQYYKDLYKFDFIFLQHGIIKDDLSSWLHKQNKNIKIFVTSNQLEYNSIIEGDYQYDKNIVKLTGLPRYDNLVNDILIKKQIVIMPTWRKTIAAVSDKLGIRQYNPKFKDSEYFKFYNTLINDERIINNLEKYGYTMKFCIHPCFREQNIDFEGNKYVIIDNGVINYQKEFKENKLLITDYSSVAFDFGYLKKPIIYTFFDIDSFYTGHMYEKGYFDYERDGLGEVCYNYETTVKEIIKYIQNDCKLEEKYEKRMNDFYYKIDTNNCKRVHDEILKFGL